MLAVWRLLLVWLMVLALPVQGMAAAGMLHCVASNAPSPGSTWQHGAVDGGHRHTHHPSASMHGQVGKAAAHAGVDAGGTTRPDGGQLPDPGHKCSACAACCLALALPVRSVDLPFPLPEHFAGTGPVEAVRSFIPGRLERPPRLLFA